LVRNDCQQLTLFFLDVVLSSIIRFVNIIFAATAITRDECLHLNDILGVKTLSGCYNVKHTLSKRDDSFQSGQIAEDDTKHRSSWLMPRVARRMTRESPHHVSKWRQDVTVDDSDCTRLRALLTEKMGSPADAEEHLPAACKRM
jgi:hypothetical protein